MSEHSLYQPKAKGGLDQWVQFIQQCRLTAIAQVGSFREVRTMGASLTFREVTMAQASHRGRGERAGQLGKD
jgi:hypothetical protein